MATFLFFDLSAFSHFNNFRVVNFAWLIFQNIGDLGRICPAEERLVIFFVEGAIPILNHHFFAAVHAIDREKHPKSFCVQAGDLSWIAIIKCRFQNAVVDGSVFIGLISVGKRCSNFRLGDFL